MDPEPYRHCVTLLKILGFSDTRFNGYKVTSVLGKQGSRPLGLADPNVYRDHTPTIGHEPGDGFQVLALLLRNGNEEPGAGPRQYQILPLNSKSIGTVYQRRTEYSAPK